MLQFAVTGEFDQLAFDQLPLAGIDMAIGFGCADQRLENRLAVQLGLRCRQAIQGLWLGLWRIGLLRLPVAVSLVGNHAKRGQATIGQRLAAHLARTLVAQQHAQRTGGQRATTRPLEQSAEITALATFTGAAEQTAQSTTQATGRATSGTAGGFLLHQVLAGFQQLIKQATGNHQALSLKMVVQAHRPILEREVSPHLTPECFERLPTSVKARETGYSSAFCRLQDCKYVK